jgi:hypothetical protein
LVDTTDGLINSWLIRKSPYQQLVVDKELIVDKVVLINKEPYPVDHTNCLQVAIKTHSINYLTERRWRASLVL